MKKPKKHKKTIYCQSCKTELQKKYDDIIPYALYKEGKVAICNYCIQDLYNMHIEQSIDCQKIVEASAETIKTAMQEMDQDESKTLENKIEVSENNLLQKIEYAKLHVKNQDDELSKIITTIEFNLDATTKKVKSNILIQGASGSGKTLITEILQDIFETPIVLINATEFTKSGYVGKNVEDMVKQLYLRCGGNKKKAERGIICIDEIDKKASRSGSTNLDSFDEDFLDSLLTMLQGQKIIFTHNHKDIEIDTSFITFIGMGAFTGIDEIRSKRISGKGTIGFITKDNDLNNKIEKYTYEDFEEYGLHKQFITRFPNIVELNNHDLDSLTEIVSSSHSSGFIMWKNELEQRGVTLEIPENLYSKVAQKALESTSGARGINNVMQYIFGNIKKDLSILSSISAIRLGDNITEDNTDYEVIINKLCN